jgi:hypothetical protein
MKKRTTANRPGQGLRVAIGWYSLQDWQLLKQIAADPEALHATYREWVAEVEKTIKIMRDAGTVIEKLPVDVTELQRWCESRGVQNTGRNRADFIPQKQYERGIRF